jgi:hypothetical protein
MWKITPSGRLFLRVRFSKGSLNNYEGGLNNMVVHVISAPQRYFYRLEKDRAWQPEANRINSQ